MRIRWLRFSWVIGLSSLMIGLMLIVLLGGHHPADRAHGAETAVQFMTPSGPITGQVRVLCYATTTNPPLADRLLTVVDGSSSEPLPMGCNYLTALYQLHEQPSGKAEHGPAYQIYATSWPPTETVPLPASGSIVMREEWPLTLFNVVVSLGWEPSSETAVLTTADMRNSLRDASANLFDLTEGQMAFGPVTIYTGGDHWDAADIRVIPANDKRPTAFVGGIVNDPLTYNSGVSSVIYEPAAIYLGRAWDAARGPVAPGGGLWTVTPTGTHSIIHEWGHYALFLYDEYQQSGGSRAYCICNDLPSGCGLGDLAGSAMAYQYTAGEFWHQITHLSNTDLPVCWDTWNWEFHGNTDWKIIANWAAIQELPPTVQPIQFPSVLEKQTSTGLTGHLFGLEPGIDVFLPLVTGGSGDNPVLLAEPEIEIYTEALPAPSGTIASSVYVLEGGSDSPTRILRFGRARGDSISDRLGLITLPGISQNDSARIFVERYADGARYSYPPSAVEDTELYGGRQVYADLQSWEYELDHRFEVKNGRVTTLTLSLETTAVGNAPTIQLCAMDAAIGCHPDWQQEMTEDTPYWHAVFTPLSGTAELPRYLIVRIQADDIGFKGEAIQELRVHGGVGPGHGDGIAPLADAEVMINAPDPIVGPGDCNIASFAPARSSAALAAPLPIGIGGIIDQPWLIRISFPASGDCPVLVPGQNSPFSQNIILNLGYFQSDIYQLGIPETSANLIVLHFDPAGNWSTGQTIDVNQELNWLAASIPEDGIYAIGWIP